jgi:hypothetical protein
MSAAEMVLEFARRGIRLEAKADRLRFYPRSALTPDLYELLKVNKVELLALIERIEERAAIMEFDAGVSRREAEQLAWNEYSTTSLTSAPSNQSHLLSVGRLLALAPLFKMNVPRLEPYNRS